MKGKFMFLYKSYPNPFIMKLILVLSANLIEVSFRKKKKKKKKHVESKQIGNDQELIQSDSISCPQIKREKTKYIN